MTAATAGRHMAPCVAPSRPPRSSPDPAVDRSISRHRSCRVGSIVAAEYAAPHTSGAGDRPAPTTSRPPTTPPSGISDHAQRMLSEVTRPMSCGRDALEQHRAEHRVEEAGAEARRRTRRQHQPTAEQSEREHDEARGAAEQERHQVHRYRGSRVGVRRRAAARRTSTAPLKTANSRPTAPTPPPVLDAHTGTSTRRVGLVEQVGHRHHHEMPEQHRVAAQVAASPPRSRATYGARRPRPS